MYQKQNSKVKVTFTGFYYHHVATFVCPSIRSGQNELGAGSDGSANGNELPGAKSPVVHCLVGTPTVDTSTRPVADHLACPSAASSKTFQTTDYRRIDLEQPGFLRLRDVLTILPISRAAWYAGIKSGLYPPSVSLGGGRSVGWPTSAIKMLIDDLTTTSVTTGSHQIKSKKEGCFTT